MRLALAGVLLLSAACFTPVAEQCRSKRCLADGGSARCSVGSTRECGTATGVCKLGRQSCSTDGTWGRCVGGVEPGVEVCDGKDNNCDGVVDEGVGRMCPLQKGVCAGSAGGCAGDGGCEQAYGAQYQVVETRCDGLDNDCDGVVDRSSPLNVSQSPGVVSRNAVAVKAPGSDALIVLYEEGQKVAARVVAADGTLSQAVAPSVTVEASTRSWAPAIAVSGTIVVAAWAEEIGAIKRVMVASLDPSTGRSDLASSGALLAMTATNPVEIAIGVDQGASRLLLVLTDSTGLRVAGFSSTLPPPMGAPAFSLDPYDLVGRRPRVAQAGSGAFLLGYDTSTGRLERIHVSAMGVAVFHTNAPQGQNACFFTSDAGATSYFLGGGSTAKQILRSNCSVLTSSVTCDSPVALTNLGDLDGLRVIDANLATWQLGVSSPRVILADAARIDAGIDLGPGRRPHPVALSALAAAVFDTESVVSAAVSSDEIYLLKSCR